MAFRGTTGSIGVFPAVASFRGTTSPIGVFGSVPAEPRAWFILDYEAQWPGEPRVEEGVAGGGEHFVALPLLHAEYELTVSGSLRIVRPVEVRIPTRIRVPVPLEARFAGQLSLSREVEMRFEGARSPAHRYAGILRDDEELLLL